MMERVLYIKMPRGYPEEICERLRKRLSQGRAGSIRIDLVRLTKEGFGLDESPRLQVVPSLEAWSTVVLLAWA